ncbi:MAG: redoxin domain-containing protein [Chloroflexi bacterium]|nr:redoxin domain-containing protein [Chloroflexota bacterium]
MMSVALKVGMDVGEIHPDFALQDLDGKTVRLRDYAGKNVLIFMWASW